LCSVLSFLFSFSHSHLPPLSFTKTVSSLPSFKPISSIILGNRLTYMPCCRVL
jgi:hypothetical protein